MYKWMLWICTVETVLVACVVSLKIGAFNVRVFGSMKAGNEDVMSTLAKICVRYDILLIQEIRDTTGDSIVQLQQQIQKDHKVKMEIIVSDRLGRTRSKEQYAFLYRADRGVSVLDSYHFDDGDEGTGDDLFQREPFIVRFQAKRTGVSDVTLVALHTAPIDTVKELTSLTTVVDDVRRRWRTTKIMILGDLNADCTYVPKKAWPTIPLRQDKAFWWAIGDEVDTTVNGNTDCAYDRFIVYGTELRQAVVRGSAKVFNFPLEYKMSEEQALAVSDHYPIEIELQDAPKVSSVSNSSSRSSKVIAMFSRLWNRIVNSVTGRSEL